MKIKIIGWVFVIGSVLIWVVDRTTLSVSTFFGKVYCKEDYLKAVDGISGDVSCGFKTDMYLASILFVLLSIGIIILVILKKKEKTIIQKIVVGGVVFKEGKVLILQRSSDETVFPDMWELPSGKREPLETSANTLHREILEETGINVETVMPVSVFDYQIEKGDVTKDSTQINFITKPKNSKECTVQLSKEHQKFEWIKEGDIDNYNLTDATKKVIQEAFHFSKLLNI